MELRNLTLDDLSLYEGHYCNPVMMEHLGGAWARERIPEKLRRDVLKVEAGTAWIFKVIPDGTDGRAAGSVCIWEHAEKDEIISEIGWFILPEFQGRGLATEAVRAILDKARTETRWGVIHAFPATTNPPSNAICRKTGFSLIEECDLEYAGHMLRCNHWRLDDPHSASPA